MNNCPLQIGQEFDVPHPFVLESVILFEENGPCDVTTWRPGIRYELIAPDDSEAVAEGVGHQHITIVGIYRPEPFPTRIFYTRKWHPPTGQPFGKRKCLIKTQDAFKRIVKGYRYPYRLVKPARSPSARPSKHESKIPVAEMPF